MKVERVIFQKALEENRLTLTEASLIAGVSRQAILHILSGRNNPSWKTQEKLVQFFKIPSEKLFSKTKKRNL